MIRLIITAVIVGIIGATPMAAQERSRPAVVGYLGATNPKGHAIALAAFQEGLRDHGWVEGRNVVVEYRWAEGANEPDLLRLHPAVIVSECGPALAAVRQASRSVAVVVWACADPEHFHGEIASIARPGGRTTGFTFLAPEASGGWSCCANCRRA